MDHHEFAQVKIICWNSARVNRRFYSSVFQFTWHNGSNAGFYSSGCYKVMDIAGKISFESKILQVIDARCFSFLSEGINVIASLYVVLKLFDLNSI